MNNLNSRIDLHSIAPLQIVSRIDLHSIAPLQRYIHYTRLSPLHLGFGARRDRIVVSTLRCGRNNPGSNPGLGNLLTVSILAFSLQY